MSLRSLFVDFNSCFASVGQHEDRAGKKIVVSIDFYDAPCEEASGFLERFSKDVFLIPSCGDALKQSGFVKDIAFEANFETLPK